MYRVSGGWGGWGNHGYVLSRCTVQWIWVSLSTLLHVILYIRMINPAVYPAVERGRCFSPPSFSLPVSRSLTHYPGGSVLALQSSPAAVNKPGGQRNQRGGTVIRTGALTDTRTINAHTHSCSEREGHR